ncbi:MAG TPA: hypothetical protein VFW38_11455 [Solirubrobacteraceae bacterium]|nr:hypothetical protein [Solirubrobacteraceae bacterium]
MSLLLVACTSACVCASTMASPGFGVARFTIQTTLAKEVTQVFEGKPVHEYLYEPYSFTQAAGHPYAVTGTLELNSEPTESGAGDIPEGGDAKDVVVDLPQGLLGNPMALPRCALDDFTRHAECPASTQVGVAEVEFNQTILVEEIYNLVPEAGQSAEFGIPTGGTFNLVLTAHVVRSGGKYALALTSNGIPMRGSTRFTTTFWGVPADPSHDAERGRKCGTDLKKSVPVCHFSEGGGEPAGVAPVPFLTYPADCAADSEKATVIVDSWQNHGSFVAGPEATLPVATGCQGLSFEPSIGVSPDLFSADSPVGLGVDLQIPQPELAAVPSTPELRDATVTLPEGLSVNPGVVDGIAACDATGPSGLNLVGPESEQLGPDGEPQLAPGKCPDASIVGEAEAVTPLLPEPVKGHLYLARPLCGGAGQEACVEEDARDGRLYRLYLELGGTGALANAGVNIKAEGVVSVNLATGQVSSSFTDNPQLPFSDLKLRLNGGPRAPLANPQACGEARTTSDLAPWSAAGANSAGQWVTGTPDASPSSFYEVSGCQEPAGLAPGFAAEMTSSRAGAFATFGLDITRKDGEQDLSGLQVHTPPGLLGMLSSVPLCGEPDAARGTCPAASRIGSSLVASGAGSHPFEVGGNVYLTTGYKGAPFGLSVVTHAVAGPFDLGLIVVRARIDVDTESSTITVTSDPLPQTIFGVPLRLKRISVRIDRPGFMFNPTDCNALAVSAVVTGAQNAAAHVSSPFAVAGCRDLAFKPGFKVSTSGRTSRRAGASIDAKLSFPAFKPAGEANIARVKVSLPRQLPSRLSTLQKACPAAVFTRDPSRCPEGSVVGIARASTPVLPVGLSGPAYFVSHGGEAFPSLVIVLQGDGVRVDVTGTTFINERTNITSTTFKTVPDVPVNSFELYLPQGPNSALAANGNLCAKTKLVTVKRRVKGRTVRRHVRKPFRLVMPTEFVGQNGDVIHRSTTIAVTGCAAKAAGARTKLKRRGADK